jgi:protein phosphatase 1 regulatory subunit 42
MKRKEKRTTIMIRHIPNKYNMTTLIDELNEDFKGKFDILYLPLDKSNHCNLGFGFINFLDPIHIIHFYDEYRGKRWQKFNSDKICELANAKFQGRNELMAHIDKNCLTKSEANIFFQDISTSALELPLVLLFYIEIFGYIC